MTLPLPRPVFDANATGGGLGKLPDWDLTDLYAAPDAPEFARDMAWLEKACADFAASYEGKLASLDAAALLTCVLTSAVVVFVVITPTMMQKTFGMTASHTFALSSLGIVFLNIGCVIAGLIVDRIGAWRTVMLYSLLLPLGIGVLYASLPSSAAAGLSSESSSRRFIPTT